MATIALAAGAALASTATAAGAGLSALAAGGISAGTLIQGGATAASMIASLGAGQEAADSGKTQFIFSRYAADVDRGEAELAAENEEMQATQEFIVGESRAAAIREGLNRVLGQQTVAFAAAGVDPTSGTALRLAEASEKLAGRDIDIEQSNAKIAGLRAKQRAATLRRRGSLSAFEKEASGLGALRRGENAQTASYIKAVSTAASFGADVARRGR